MYLSRTFLDLANLAVLNEREVGYMGEGAVLRVDSCHKEKPTPLARMCPLSEVAPRHGLRGRVNKQPQPLSGSHRPFENPTAGSLPL